MTFFQGLSTIFAVSIGLQQSINPPIETLKFKTVQIQDQSILDKTRKIEATNLYKQAKNLYKDGKYQQAISLYQESLIIWQSLNQKDMIGNSFNAIGSSYYQLDNYETAISFYERALKIYQEINDAGSEANMLYVIAASYSELGQTSKAISIYPKAYQVFEKLGDKLNQAKVLINAGIDYRKVGQYSLALQQYQKAQPLLNEITNKNELSVLSNGLGSVYSLLGQYDNASKFYQKAIDIISKDDSFQSLRNRAIYINNLGYVFTLQKKYDLALKSYQRSLSISKKIDRIPDQGIALSNIGYVNIQIGRTATAINNLNLALGIIREYKDKDFEARILDSLGDAYKQVGKYSEALNFYRNGLVVAKESGDRTTEAVIMSNLGNLFAKQGNTAGAIVFYKQAVNTYENIRKDIRGLPKELQNSYKETVAGSYRQLADLLLQQNRVLEAQRVLDLLKVQELDEFLRGVRGNPNTQRGIENLPPEQQINQGYQKLIDQAVDIGKELTDLRSIKPKERTIAQDQRISQLDQQETELVKAFTKFIDSDEIKTLLKKLEAIAFNQQDLLGRLSEFNALQDNLRNLQQEAVLLYPLILENRLELVLVTPYSPPIRRTVNVTSKELNQTIVDFRSALENPRIDATKPAQKLYDWLIKPIEKDLDTANTKTIIYAPDGQLRYIPIAALHDGKQWLVERYRVNNITAASLTDLNTKPQRELSVLAGAYTTAGKKHNFKIGDEQFNFAGLSYAEMEVTKLAETIPETTQLRDEGFSFKITKPKMDDYAIVHFATHAAFLKGQPEKSFILFGNGDRISLTDIKEGAFGSLKKVDLFVLSACETGVGGNFGTGAEILGFGYLMQTAGARAAIASLWKVNDSGTQALMNTLYATLANNAITKAEALRQAQIALITGDYKNVAGSRGQMVAIEQRIRQGIPNDVANNLSHPYYWASFILIGNGL
ncbi:MAG: CHAT domain-containing protein [Pseudanabaena sp. M046S1SP1A06QC]|jgi:CHAT domain-containing protein/lipopolysaccharide biosynthesis regulator YciM|nr:CHAT domain-containing protein [Pseudanabaena sp. M046S1SP1A06QC]